MAITVEFDDEELPRLFGEVATGGPTFETAIMGLRGGMKQPYTQRFDAIRSWDIQFGALNETQKLQLETFFLTKYGRAIGFCFMPPGDNKFENDLIATGNGGASYQLYRKYVSAGRTITRKILKPIQNSNLPLGYAPMTATVGGAPGTVSLINSTTGVITLSATVGAGVEIRIQGGAFCVPVVFDTDVFECSEHGNYSDIESIRLVELLPVALGY